MNSRYKKTYLDFKQHSSTGANQSVNRSTFQVPRITPRPNYHQGPQKKPFTLPSISKPSISLPSGKVLGRIVFYGLTIFAINWLWSYKSSEYQKIEDQKQQTIIQQQALQENLKKVISVYSAPAKQVMSEGVTLLKSDNLELASAYLARAGELDANLRDAFVYSGFAYIQLANKSQDAEKSKGLADEALKQLKQAAEIDPLHSYTFELLAFAYEFLGQSENAAAAQERAKTVTLN